MACPQCGGQQRDLLSPGFYRCTTSNPAGFVPPGAAGNPTAAALPLMRVCGHEYQESSGGQGLPTCSCGMFAVALCTECEVPLCGTCLRRSTNGRVVCSRHLPPPVKISQVPEVEPAPVSVTEHLRAAEARQLAQAVAAERERANRTQRVGELASDLHGIIDRTVRSILESGSTASLGFTIQTSERRKGAFSSLPRRPGPHVEDPTRIATHRLERWDERYGMYRSYCEFDGVYPLYWWVSEKLRGSHGTTRAQLGSVWCNSSGLVVASSRPYNGIVSSNPYITWFPTGGLPAETHVGDWLPTGDLITPTPLDRLTDGDFRRVVEAAGLTSLSGVESRIASAVASILIRKR